MTDASNAKLLDQLQEIIRREPNSLRSAVATEAISSNNPAGFLNDLRQHGCVSGMVGSLIWYSDTHAFFDLYYDHIEVLRQEWQDEIGQPLEIVGDLKNFLAWFAFESAAHEILIELELDE